MAKNDERGRRDHGAPPAAGFQRLNPEEWGLPRDPIGEPRLIESAFEVAVSRGVNLLAPEMRIDFIPPYFAVSLRLVMFDPDWPTPNANTKSNGKWYVNKQGRYCLHHICLTQLAQLASVQVTRSERVDDGMEPLIWRYMAAGSVRQFDGGVRTEVVNYELDLHDGSPQFQNMHESQRTQARVHGSRLAESKCKSALYRELLGVAQGYTYEEAKRPFCWPALVFMPPVNNPEVLKMIAAREFGITADVFGPGGAPRQILDHQPAAPETRQIAEALPPAPAEREREREREPARREEPRQERRLEEPPENTAQEICSRPGCGAPVGPELAAWGRKHLDAVFCRPDAKRAQEARST